MALWLYFLTGRALHCVGVWPQHVSPMEFLLVTSFRCVALSSNLGS